MTKGKADAEKGNARNARKKKNAVAVGSRILARGNLNNLI